MPIGGGWTLLQNITIALGHAAIDFYMNTLPSLLPFFIQRFDLNFTLVGILIAVRAIAGSFTQPLFGYFVDQGGRGSMLIVGLLWVALMTAFLGIAPSYWWIVLLISLGPLGSGIYHPLGSAILRERYTPDKIGMVTSIYIVAGTIGYALAPMVTVAVVMAWGLSGTLVLAIPGVLVGGGLILSGFSKVQLGPGKTVIREKVKEGGAWGSQWLASKGQVLLLSLAAVLRSWTYVGLVNFLPLYYISRGFSPQYGSYMLTVYLLCGSVGTLIGGRLSDDWGRRRVTAISLVLAGIMLTVYLNTSGIVQVVFLGLTGFTLLSSMSVTTVHAQELMIGNTAMAAGLMMGLVYGIGGLLAALSGRIADLYDLHFALSTLVVVLIPAVMAILAVPDPHQDRLHQQKQSLSHN